MCNTATHSHAQPFKSVRILSNTLVPDFCFKIVTVLALKRLFPFKKKLFIKHKKNCLCLLTLNVSPVKCMGFFDNWQWFKTTYL